MQVVNNFAAVLAAVNNTAGSCKNDHTGAGMNTVFGIAKLVSGNKEFTVSLHQSRYFSLNAMYVDQFGLAHISRNSCGGCVEVFDKTMEQSILDYNEGQSTNIITASFITDVHFLVDGKLQPVDLVSPEKLAELQAKVKEGYDAWKARDVK